MQQAKSPHPETAEARATAWLRGRACVPPGSAWCWRSFWSATGHNRHVTAEGLHEAALAEGAPVSLATVYNTLRAFCGAGLVAEVIVDGTRSYFDTRVDDHPHYFWEEDGRLTDAPFDAVRIADAPVAPTAPRSPASRW